MWRKGGDVPNWSQLLRTPMSLRPSRRATMSFSEGRGGKQDASTVCAVRAGFRRGLLTVCQVEQLGGRGEHLRRELGRLLRRGWGRRGPAAEDRLALLRL